MGHWTIETANIPRNLIKIFEKSQMHGGLPERGEGGRMGGFGIDLKCKISLIFLFILPDPYTQELFQAAQQINVQYTLYS